MKVIACLVLGYLLGSIPWALVIGKVFYKIDVRQYGSGNLGATNVGRVLGPFAYWVVGVLDAIKSIAAYLIVTLVTKNVNYGLFTGMAVIIGHCYPVFANFKGGKGVAASIGFLAASALPDFKLVILQFLVPFISLIVINKTTKYAVVGSCCSLAIASFLAWIFNPNKMCALTITIITLFVTYKHKANIIRLINGEELKTDQKAEKKD